MINPNNVSITITEADLAEITAGIQTLQTKLMPYLLTLSPADRHDLPKMGDKSVGFVQKTREYCAKNPDLVPPFLDVDGFNVDVQNFEQIRSMYQPLLQITDSLRNTMLLTGSEAYSASLKFYNAVKNAAKSRFKKPRPSMTTSLPVSRAAPEKMRRWKQPSQIIR